MTDWENISIAPRDGTKILLAYKEYDVSEIEVAFWHEKWKEWDAGHYLLSDDCEIKGWLPLPPFPKKKVCLKKVKGAKT